MVSKRAVKNGNGADMGWELWAALWMPWVRMRSALKTETNIMGSDHDLQQRSRRSSVGDTALGGDAGRGSEK